jgi:Protein of unknown function (DUF1302)
MGLGVLLLLGQAPRARAVELFARDELRLRWDNTIRLSTMVRLQEASDSLLANINADDGNRNFDRGFTSARVDLLSELDFTYRAVGLRVSGAAWYDLIYHLDTDNDSPATVNSFSVGPKSFTHETRDLHGRKAELLDAFGFITSEVGGTPYNIRVGRHTLLWGESLLIADQGISNAQAPLDAIKGLSVPGSQAKELFMPVGQISAQIGPVRQLSLAGFYQIEWRRTRLPAAGSYFSSSDILDAGGERLLLPNGGAFFRGEDLDARWWGQWGLALRYDLEALDVDLGLYFINYHDKTPQVYLRPGLNVDASVGKAGEYQLVFQEDIRLVGASVATSMGALALTGEAHVRFGTPLASTALTAMADVVADNDEHPLYARGNTGHALVAGTYIFNPSFLWDTAAVVGEMGVQVRFNVTENEAVLDTTRDRAAWGMRVLFTPTYFQVLPGLDLSVPFNFAFNPFGNSPIAGFNGGADLGGSVGAGISAEFRKVWLSSLQFSWFFGDERFQTRKDRAFASFVIQRTF